MGLCVIGREGWVNFTDINAFLFQIALFLQKFMEQFSFLRGTGKARRAASARVAHEEIRDPLVQDAAGHRGKVPRFG